MPPREAELGGRVSETIETSSPPLVQTGSHNEFGNYLGGFDPREFCVQPLVFDREPIVVKA